MTTLGGCVFCLDNELLDGEVVARTERAFLVANPRIGVPGAHLIIPIDHVEELLPDWWQAEVNALLPFIPWWKPGANRNECTNFGYDAGQRIPHLHTHVIPRTPDQGQVGLGTFVRKRMKTGK